MNEKEFVLALEKVNIHITEKQLQQFSQYADLLEQWNQKMNLTAIRKSKKPLMQ